MTSRRSACPTVYGKIAKTIMLRAAHRSVLALAILASLFAGRAARNSIANGAATIPRLYWRITSYEVLNDPDEFVIGYYLDRDDQPGAASLRFVQGCGFGLGHRW